MRTLKKHKRPFVPHKKAQCPDYMRDAFNEANDADEVSTLLENKLKAHLRTLCRDIKRR